MASQWAKTNAAIVDSRLGAYAVNHWMNQMKYPVSRYTVGSIVNSSISCWDLPRTTNALDIKNELGTFNKMNFLDILIGSFKRSLAYDPVGTIGLTLAAGTGVAAGAPKILSGLASIFGALGNNNQC